MNFTPATYSIDITDLTGGKTHPTLWRTGVEGIKFHGFQEKLDQITKRLLSQENGVYEVTITVDPAAGTELVPAHWYLALTSGKSKERWLRYIRVNEQEDGIRFYIYALPKSVKNDPTMPEMEIELM